MENDVYSNVKGTDRDIEGNPTDPSKTNKKKTNKQVKEDDI